MNVSAMNCLGLVQIEHALTADDLVTAALEARAVAARILQHREDRLMQLQIQVQDTRRRRLRLQAASAASTRPETQAPVSLITPSSSGGCSRL